MPFMPFSSSTRRLSSSETAVARRFFFSIRRRPRGPPIKLPTIRPNVADAVHIVVAPLTLRLSSTGPKAPAVPWPPTIGIDPVHKPINGLMCRTPEIPSASRFWRTIKKISRTRNIISDLPPLLLP